MNQAAQLSQHKKFSQLQSSRKVANVYTPVVNAAFEQVYTKMQCHASHAAAQAMQM